MMKRYIIGALALLTMSCSGFLKEYSQDLAYVHSYTDLDELLLGGGYLKFDENTLYCPYLHLLSDDVQENIAGTGMGGYSGIRERYFGYYTWQERVDLGFDNIVTGAEDGDWNRFYEHINVANMVLAEIDNHTGVNDFEVSEINRVRGEAYFLRGAYYFWLANLYGKPYQAATAATDPAVPLKSTEYIEDKKFTRNSVQEVYEQVLSDLEQAGRNLLETTPKSIYRAGLTAVYLLQSRVYLYMGNWEQAEYYAREVLERNDRLTDLNTFSGENFLTSQCAEVIFSTGANGMSEDRYSMRTKDFSASAELLAAYSGSDLRLERYFTTDYPPYYPCKKYPVYQSELSDVYILRTAEAYLNLAEACFYQNDEAGARTALNTLRQNRFRSGSNYEITSSGAALIADIRNERFRELCFEGHRWFDLRRYGVDGQYPLETTLRHSYTTYDGNDDPLQTFVYELQPGDAAYTLPIPKEVRAQDELITNNPRNPRGVAETINYN